MDRKQIEQYIEMYSQITQSITNSMHTIQKIFFKNSIITPEQFHILNDINARDTCTSSLLANEFNVKKSTITAIVNRLADKGLVKRIYNEKDRRVYILKLTEKGQCTLNEEKEKIFEKLKPLGYKLSEEGFEKLRVNLSLIDAQLKTIKKEMNKYEK